LTTDEFIRDIIPLQPAMRRMAEMILHDDAQAADAVQETLTHLWSKRWKLDRVDDKQGYCMRALRNECVDMLRKQRPTVEADSLADTLADTSSYEALEAERRYRQLEKAIAQLSPVQQMLVRLKFTEGHSTKEIAAITGLSPSNVDTIMSRVYSLLRIKLQ
jgi:RNA polymerase sigma-70 factor (ECF subfamily)